MEKEIVEVDDDFEENVKDTQLVPVLLSIRLSLL